MLPSSGFSHASPEDCAVWGALEISLEAFMPRLPLFREGFRIVRRGQSHSLTEQPQTLTLEPESPKSKSLCNPHVTVLTRASNALNRFVVPAWLFRV